MQETCHTVEIICNIFSKKIKLQQKKPSCPSSVFNLGDNQTKVRELIGRLRTKAAEYIYKETDRHLNEQFIKGLNDDTIRTEIKRELTAIKDTSTLTSCQELTSAK